MERIFKKSIIVTVAILLFSGCMSTTGEKINQYFEENHYTSCYNDTQEDDTIFIHVSNRKNGFSITIVNGEVESAWFSRIEGRSSYRSVLYNSDPNSDWSEESESEISKKAKDEFLNDSGFDVEDLTAYFQDIYDTTYMNGDMAYCPDVYEESRKNIEYRSGQYYYEEVDETITITDFDGTMSRAIIPESLDGKPVTGIGWNTFYQRTHLTQIEIPDTVKTIEGSAFYRCYSLGSIVIPKSVENIDGSAFFRCIRLTSIEVDPLNPNFISIDGVLFDKEMKRLIAYPEGSNTRRYYVPDGVEEIEAAFGYHPYNLEELYIPDSVVKFPEYNIFIFPDDIILRVKEGSLAEQYAMEYNLNYIYY